jgi:hypothetical protein
VRDSSKLLSNFFLNKKPKNYFSWSFFKDVFSFITKMLSNLKTNRKQRGLDLADMAGENLSFQQAQESGSEVLDWFI